MISDTLFDAISEIDGYLNDPTYTAAYAEPMRTEIIRVRDEMERLRATLDDVDPVLFADKEGAT